MTADKYDMALARWDYIAYIKRPNTCRTGHRWCSGMQII